MIRSGTQIISKKWPFPMLHRNYLSQDGHHLGMTEKFTLLVEEEEDGYLIGSVVELPGCRTQAKTQDDLLVRAREAIELYLEVESDSRRNRFLGLQQIEV